jgi:hypothetical protein
MAAHINVELGTRTLTGAGAEYCARGRADRIPWGISGWSSGPRRGGVSSVDTGNSVLSQLLERRDDHQTELSRGGGRRCVPGRADPSRRRALTPPPWPVRGALEPRSPGGGAGCCSGLLQRERDGRILPPDLRLVKIFDHELKPGKKKRVLGRRAPSGGNHIDKFRLLT